MTLQEQSASCPSRFCEYCGCELKGQCHCWNSKNEEKQFDKYTGLPLEKD